MKNAVKGALFSSLVFPGLGQVVLKSYWRGAIIISAVLVALSILVKRAVNTAQAVVDELLLDGGVIDMSRISDAATEASTMSADITSNSLLLLLLFCWVFSTVDAFRIGKKIDVDERSLKT
jgi:hypothetical protein